MAIGRQPRSILFISLTVLGIAAFLPLAVIAVQLCLAAIEQPSKLQSAVLSGRQAILLGRSLAVAASATVVAVALGFPAAFILASKDLPKRLMFSFLVVLPLFIPPYVMAGAWVDTLSPTGLVNRTIMALCGPDARLTIFSFAGCAWCLGISFFPVVAIMTATGLANLDRNLQDIAHISTNAWGVFRHSTLVQIMPHLVASICLVMIFVLAQYGVPSLLGINTYPVEIFSQFSAFYDDTAAAATALPLIVVVVLLVLIQKRFMRNRDYVRITAASEAEGGIRLGKAMPLGIVFLIIVSAITTWLPFSVVLGKTSNLGMILTTIWSFRQDIITTMVFAAAAAIIVTIAGWSIGYYLTYAKGRFARMLDILCWLPIAVPGTIIGLGIIKAKAVIMPMLANDGFGWMLVVAYVGMFIAFSIRIFEASYKRHDPNITEAAAMDCGRWHHRLVHVDIPLHIGAIAASFALVFLLAVGELNATVLLIPPGKATLAVTIDNLLHYGSNLKASVLCLATTMFSMVIVGGGCLAYSLFGKGRT